ncbi:hypothetical protein GPECTOR_3g361 [Gonium pectorale]|uniref:Uncharacterized protein n=1 Tax=Gonium pectorale TaxID=33097 RepID=A0A150GZD2_GONPE|nr:hypothetical protein GPECTOR_3g361 [Gonium pectorale]|eukprot:KXZ55219.1 hypothetical protein GPECTOR_3g361 [Gonium pectorale]
MRLGTFQDSDVGDGGGSGGGGGGSGGGDTSSGGGRGSVSQAHKTTSGSRAAGNSNSLTMDEIAAATAALSSAEAIPRAERWRRWLDACIDARTSPVLTLVVFLVDMPHLSWDAARVRAVQDCLLAAAIEHPAHLMRMVATAAALVEVLGPGAIQGIYAEDDVSFETGASSALCDIRALTLLRLAASLEPAAGEGPEPPAEGLPPACANPRCTNLTGESDAGLMAVTEAAGGGGRDGGGDGCSDWNGGSGGAGLRAGCSPECQRASEGRSAEGGGGGRAEAKAGAAAGRRRGS